MLGKSTLGSAAALLLFASEAQGFLGASLKKQFKRQYYPANATDVKTVTVRNALL